MSPTPRGARTTDAAAIAALVRRAFATQSVPTNPPASALKETVATISAHLAQGGGAVVESDDQLLGAILWAEEDGGLYLSRLSVHPDHRRRGIARALIAEAEREARRRRLGLLHLGTRLVLEDNRRLFRACGFQETSVHRHEGFDEPTWVRMERRLD
jgi:ribosomal protein S18 acetylase RimI-like enzyme